MEFRYGKVGDWPTEPRTLKDGKSRPGRIIGNVLYLLLSCLFFVFGGLIAFSDGTPKTDLVQNLDTASRYGPTIFPVLYALIVGSSIRSFALWRLQGGAKIGFLDLLLGSTSVGGTVATQWELQFRHMIIPSICLLGIWAISPLGSQASIRIIGYENIPVVKQQEVSYLDLSRATFPSGMESGDNGGVFDSINTAFVASLVSPQVIRDGQQDTWGNVKVPFLESLPAYGHSGYDEWIPLSDQPTDILYSSLIGIPTANISHDGVTAFTMETSYWNLQCPQFGYPDNYDDHYWTNMTDVEACLESLDTPCVISNLTISNDLVAEGVRGLWGWIISITNTEDERKRCESKRGDEAPLRHIFYRSDNLPPPGSSSILNPTAANCSITTSYVEVSVECTSDECRAVQIRRSQNNGHRSDSWTTLDSCSDNVWGFKAAQFLSKLVNAADHQRSQSGTPGILQTYMEFPANAFCTTYQEINLSSLGNSTFAIRFAQLLNTYWSAVYGFSTIFQGRQQSFPNITDSFFYFGDPITLVNGTNSQNETRFVYNRGWMAALIISTSAMFISAVAKLILDMGILIPELLMNMSTLLRGNMDNCPGFPLGGSTMDDSERSRLLYDQMVRFGNTSRENSRAGELGIGQVKEGEGGVAEARKDVKYW